MLASTDKGWLCQSVNENKGDFNLFLFINLLKTFSYWAEVPTNR